MKTGPLPSARTPVFYHLVACRVWEPSLGQRNLKQGDRRLRFTQQLQVQAQAWKKAWRGEVAVCAEFTMETR